MARNSLNLFVSKEKFMEKINDVEIKVNELDGIIDEYEEAKRTLDTFVGEADSAYYLWVARIDENIRACRAERAALIESKRGLTEVVEKMEGMGAKVADTVTTATDAATSSIKAAIKVETLL